MAAVPRPRAGRTARTLDATTGITALRKISSSPADCSGADSTDTASSGRIVALTPNPTQPVIPGAIRVAAPATAAATTMDGAP